jgi:flavin-dependent dehydrogenase
VNVCGLFRRQRGESSNNNSLDWLRGERGSQLFQELEHAEFDSESISAVAGLSLRPQPIDARECRIGDALTMIPPITGNGMSMAFESAQLAMEPVLSYARGELDWSKTTAKVAEKLRGRFARRLRWAALFHRVLFSRLSSPALAMLLKSERGWRAAFAATR